MVSMARGGATFRIDLEEAKVFWWIKGQHIFNSLHQAYHEDGSLPIVKRHCLDGTFCDVECPPTLLNLVIQLVIDQRNGGKVLFYSYHRIEYSKCIFFGESYPFQLATCTWP